MGDIFSKKKRSEIMSKVKTVDTKPESVLRKCLFAYGFRYRKNVKTLPGKPDIVLPKYKTVIFVHGCFWHGHECKYGAAPSSNVDFWLKKINSNKKRDKKQVNLLRNMGWNVITVWQCEINNKEKAKKRCNGLVELLANMTL